MFQAKTTFDSFILDIGKLINIDKKIKKIPEYINLKDYKYEYYYNITGSENFFQNCCFKFEKKIDSLLQIYLLINKTSSVCSKCLTEYCPHNGSVCILI